MFEDGLIHAATLTWTRFSKAVFKSDHTYQQLSDRTTDIAVLRLTPLLHK